MFKPNLEKLKWCMVWVLNQRHCTPQHLTETIFQAEIEHLNYHGRPITGVSYYKGSPIFCLEIAKIYNEIKSLNKPLPTVNTHFLSISDIACLKNSLTTNLTVSPYLQSLNNQELINYKELIFNPEIKEYLEENDPLSIVI